VKLLKALVSFIVATIVGAAGDKLFGAFGLVLGFVVGGVVAWWVVRRVLDA
jgi:hypothetical protein